MTAFLDENEIPDSHSELIAWRVSEDKYTGQRIHSAVLHISAGEVRGLGEVWRNPDRDLEWQVSGGCIYVAIAYDVWLKKGRVKRRFTRQFFRNTRSSSHMIMLEGGFQRDAWERLLGFPVPANVEDAWLAPGRPDEAATSKGSG